jgi:hypothetical protein
MTALLVITSKHPQPQLRRRRDGYQSYQQAGRYIHYLEVVTIGLITQNGPQIQIGPKWAQDIHSAQSDPTASFACIEIQNHEGTQQAISRALKTPARPNLSSRHLSQGDHILCSALK